MDFSVMNIIFNTVENIVKGISILSLYDNGNGKNPAFDTENSTLYFDDNGDLVWKRFIGTEYEGIFKVRELYDFDIEVLLDLLLSNGIISKKKYNYLLAE